jgi:hypothetical protein
LSQPADAPKPVVSPPTAASVIEAPIRQRVVYDWAAGERLVFDTGATTPTMTSQPVVGITDEQVDRITGGSMS